MHAHSGTLMHLSSWVHWHTVWNPVSAWYSPPKSALPGPHITWDMRTGGTIDMEPANYQRQKLPLSNQNWAAQYNLYQRLRTPLSPHCTRVYIVRAYRRKAGSAPSWFKAPMWPKIALRTDLGSSKILGEMALDPPSCWCLLHMWLE